MFVGNNWCSFVFQFNKLDIGTDIIKYFGHNKSFTKNDLLKYYLQTETEVNNNTLLYRISKLKKNSIINSIGRGIYIITKKDIFQPEPDNFTKKLKKTFVSKFDEINYCVWNSSSLYSLMLHQPFTSFYVYEVEELVLKETFNLFKDNGFNAFFQPEEDIIDDYLSYTKNAIIIKPLISRSSSYISKAVKMASIEKILVDIYYDRKIYPIFNISEQINIIENAYDNFIINISKIYSYSSRRNRKNEYKTFIETNFNNLFIQQ